MGPPGSGVGLHAGAVQVEGRDAVGFRRDEGERGESQAGLGSEDEFVNRVTIALDVGRWSRLARCRGQADFRRKRARMVSRTSWRFSSADALLPGVGALRLQSGRDLGVDLKHRAFALHQQHLAARRALQLLASSRLC